MELGILHNGPPSTKRGCHTGRLHRLWHGLPPAPWPCTRSQHHSVPPRNLHPLMVPPFLQPHPDLQSAVGNAPLSSKHPAQLPTTDCLLSIISPMGGQPSDAPALSPPSPLQQGGQSSNAPALSPPSLLPQGGQPIALALSPPSPMPQGGQPSDAPGLSPSSSTLLLCPSDSTLSICHLNSQSAVKTALNRQLWCGWCVQMKRRIAAFTASKRNEVSENNIREFCSDLPSAQKDGEERSTCARVDSAYVSCVGCTSHVRVTRVFNPQGPQTRGGYRDDCGAYAAGRSSPTSYTMSVEERLRNAEEHLNISSDRKADLFSRLKAVEEGMLFLSGLSPEYFPAGRMPQPKRRKVSRPEPVPEELSPTKLKTEYDSISEIDQRIFYLRDKLKKMKNQSS
ncbi:hypothetical protein ACOMHN_008991 [Nucella lapillus]